MFNKKETWYLYLCVKKAHDDRVASDLKLDEDFTKTLKDLYDKLVDMVRDNAQ